MYYFVKNGDVVEKYLVEYDKEALEKLRLEIIEKCSEIVQRSEYQYPHMINKFSNSLRYRIFSEENDERVGGKKVVRYYEYVYPPLVKHVDGLLNGVTTEIFQILNPTDIQEKKSIDSIDEEIENLAKIISEKSAFSGENVYDLRRLRNIVNYKRLNENQVSESEYYPKVQKLLTMTLVDTIDLESLARSQEFLEKSLENVNETSDGFQKVKRKQLNNQGE